MPLAMHMANELLSVPVAAGTLAVAAAAVAAAAWRARKAMTAERMPLMGVLGAFVFAGQMINFTLPGMGGVSGHLGGGVLLAIVLGPAASVLVMTAILIVQCLLFQDGGLLALGCNIINMGVVPSLLGWGLYRLTLGAAAAARPWRQYLAAWAACVAAVTAGAALVPIEAAVSGVLKISFVHFLATIVGVHVVIGLGEGLITFVVVAYLRRVRPAAVGLAASDRPGGLRRGAVVASLLGTAVLLAGVVSLFASAHPDGLEWSLEGESLAPPAPAVAAVDDWQGRVAAMPDYTRRDAAAGPVGGWTSVAGIAGTAVTLAVLYLLARLLKRRAGTQAHPPAAN